MPQDKLQTLLTLVNSPEASGSRAAHCQGGLVVRLSDYYPGPLLWDIVLTCCSLLPFQRARRPGSATTRVNAPHLAPPPRTT